MYKHPPFGDVLPTTRDRPLIGIGLKIASVLVFVAMASFIKAAGELPPGQIVFFRSFFAMLPIMIFLAWKKQLKSGLATGQPLNHILRGAVGITAMGLSFYALTRLPLSDAVVLGYAKPLMVVMVSALFLNETVGKFRWIAVALGFLGVMIISWPKLTIVNGNWMESPAAVGVFAMLASSAIAAFVMVLVRGLVETERTPTIVIWFSLTATVLSLLTYPFGWEILSWAQFGFLVAAGFSGGLVQVLLTQSYRYADVSAIAPFEYASMIFAILVGYLVFNDLPTITTLIGGSIIMASGIFIVLREHRLGAKISISRKGVHPHE